jgi:hypothetical protein
MNPELPKPMLDALAREASPTAHPSPDELTAFVERSLVGGETQKVTDHLARCAECREVVFLASNAADDWVAETEDERLVAASGLRFSSVFAASAASAEVMNAPRMAEKPSRKWVPRLVWGVSAAAGIVVVAGLVLQQRFAAPNAAPQLASNEARNISPPAQAEQPLITRQSSAVAVAAPPSVGKPVKSARSKAVPSPSRDAVKTAAQQPFLEVENSAPRAAARVNVLSDSSAATLGGVSPSTAPSVAHAGALGSPVAGAAAARDGATGRLFSAPQASNNVLNTPYARWRITAEGHLEQSTSSGWTRALADQTATFRVVSVVGSDVWAGGDGGVLFHSSDGGRTWSRVAVSSSTGAETAAIVSILFDDFQHGALITESGARYRTTDGGTTWTSQ